MRHAILVILILSSSVFLAGCETGRPAEGLGKTYYLDGAGNWGFGTYDVPSGLKEAGYSGDVEIYVWTTSMIPIVDQLNIGAAKLRAAALTDRIEQYHRRFPENRINLIALSAGTGVTIWAVEGLDAAVKVHNVILLGSSLSSDYDVGRALRNMTGRIYAYHSPHDEVLAAVSIVGTIDGKRGVSSVGQVGLTASARYGDRVVNIPWERRYMMYGWTGAHTDCVRRDFIREVVASHVVGDTRRDGGARRAASSQPRAVEPVVRIGGVEESLWAVPVNSSASLPTLTGGYDGTQK